MFYHFWDMQYYVHFQHMPSHEKIWHAICSQNNEKGARRQIWQKCYHLLSFCYHLGRLMHVWYNGVTPFSMRQMPVAKISCWICQICYHFVIIVIDNTFYKDLPIWCLFLSFFSVWKMTFFRLFFFVTIMVSFLLTYYIN